jgi:hypothetical protein
VTYRRGAATIRGTIENVIGSVVIVDASDNRPTTHSVSKGSFTIGGLRPGDYYVVAVDREQPLRASDSILQKLLTGVDKIHLDKGASVTLNLKAVPWPE